MTTDATVVVGVDGSPGSRAALHFALDDAERRNARLRVVTAAQLPEYWSMTYAVIVPSPPPDIAADAQAEAQRMVDAVVAERGGTTEVPISVEARSGSPTEVLVEAADGAELLVLGHRGRVTLRSALLGSVGLSCVLHAPCPVTVVRSEGHDRDGVLAGTSAGAGVEGR